MFNLIQQVVEFRESLYAPHHSIFQRVASNQDGRPFQNRYSTATDGPCNYTDDGCFASKHYTNGCSGHPSGTVAYTHCP